MELTLPSEHVHIDFNKICRICLSTEGLLPISMPLYYDQNSIRGKNIFCNTVEFVLTKYAHIKCDPEDKLPKQICSCCFNKLNDAYTFLRNCALMNATLTECLKRYEDALLKSKAADPVNNNNVTNSVEIKEVIKLEEIHIDHEFPITNGFELNVTDSVEIKIESVGLEELQIDHETQSCQALETINDSQFQIDFESEIPVTKIVTSVEDIYSTSHIIKQVQEVVIKRKNTKKNLIQMIRDDSNSDKRPQVIRNKRRIWTSRGRKRGNKGVNKILQEYERCRVCKREFRKQHRLANTFNSLKEYCECSVVRRKTAKSRTTQNGFEVIIAGPKPIHNNK